MTGAVLTIGVAGGTGSGKTTVAREIVRALPAGTSCIVDFDAYYRDLAHLTLEQRALVNFDDPAALETELLCAHLDALRRGEAVDKPRYNFAEHVRRAETERIEPLPFIVVEGIHVLSQREVRRRLDVKIFVDTDADIRLLRRIRRDIEERGRSLDDIEQQYTRTVRPMHLRHVEPSRRHADMIIPEGGGNQVAIGMVVGALRRLAEPG
mgnify:CR=1 FL=1